MRTLRRSNSSGPAKKGGSAFGRYRALLVLILTAAAIATVPTAAAQGDIEGTVETELGVPLDGKDVVLKQQTGTSYAEVATARTDGDGSFAFPGRENGNYLVTVTHQGIPYTQHVAVRNGSETVDFEPDYVLDGGAVGGVVRSGPDQVLRGVNVTVYSDDEAVASGTTDRYGVYLLQGLEERSTFTLELERNGVTYTRSASTDTDPLTFDREDFEFTGAVSGSVEELREGSRAPAPDVDLRLLHDGTTVAEAATDAEGNYSFDDLLDREGFTVKVADEPYRMAATAPETGVDVTLFRSAPLTLKERQMYIQPAGDGGYKLQEFIMVDQESLIASSELKSFDDGVAVIDTSFTQEVPDGTSKAFISPVMGQGVEENTVITATVDNGTASMEISNFTIDLADDEQTIGTTYRLASDPEGNLQKTLTFSKGINYDTKSAMVVNRIKDGTERHGVKLTVDTANHNSTTRFDNYVLRELEPGDTVSGEVSWKTYSSDQMKGVAGAAAAVVIGIGAVIAVRRRRRSE